MLKVLQKPLLVLGRRTMHVLPLLLFQLRSGCFSRLRSSSLFSIIIRLLLSDFFCESRSNNTLVVHREGICHVPIEMRHYIAKTSHRNRHKLVLNTIQAMHMQHASILSIMIQNASPLRATIQRQQVTTPMVYLSPSLCPTNSSRRLPGQVSRVFTLACLNFHLLTY
jgi:hypothetical protein